MDRRDAITSAVSLAVAEAAGAEGFKADASVQRGAATALERAARVIVVRSDYLPGDVRRYGANGDGVSDDSAAWRAALATGHRVLGGGSEYVYSIAQQVPITRPTVIDLQGATVKPRGETFAFVRTPPQPTVSAGVVDGATQGNRILKLGAASRFRAGQWARLVLKDDRTHDPASYPPSWSRITSAQARTVELDTPLQITYGPGDLQLVAYDPGLLSQRFECHNGIFDGSESTEDRGTGQALRIGGIERVVVQGCEFLNFRLGGELTCAVELFTNIDVLMTDCRFSGSVSRFNMCDIQESRVAHFCNNQMDGSHFGCNITRVDAGLFANNCFQGRRAAEAAEGVTPARSVRGIKAYGCASIRILGNHAADYESPIKVEACFRYDISHNTVFNAGLSPFSGQIAVNVGSIAHGSNMHDGRIIGNHVETCGGIAIGVTSDLPGGVCICENIVRACQGPGIYVGVPNVIVSANRVENWGLRNAGDAAIHVEGHATIADNRFSHATLTSLPCLSASEDGSVARDNVSESGNGLGVA